MTTTSGILYLVGTPIGNLEDITLRALGVLSAVDYVAAENVGRTKILLKSHGITARLISYREENSARKAPQIVEAVEAGKKVALVSDAGMPGISDPGVRLVELALAKGVSMQVIPGPSALLTALVASGLPTQPFHFEGFLPRGKKKRKERLRELAHVQGTLIFYEAPHRIKESVGDMLIELGDRQCAIARELTKIHEEYARGPLSQILEDLPLEKGEFTVIVAGCVRSEQSTGTGEVKVEIDELVRAGMSRSDAIRKVSRDRNLSRREIYRLAHLEEEGLE